MNSALFCRIAVVSLFAALAPIAVNAQEPANPLRSSARSARPASRLRAAGKSRYHAASDEAIERPQPKIVRLPATAHPTEELSRSEREGSLEQEPRNPERDNERTMQDRAAQHPLRPSLGSRTAAPKASLRESDEPGEPRLLPAGPEIQATLPEPLPQMPRAGETPQSMPTADSFASNPLRGMSSTGAIAAERRSVATLERAPTEIPLPATALDEPVAATSLTADGNPKPTEAADFPTNDHRPQRSQDSGMEQPGTAIPQTEQEVWPAIPDEAFDRVELASRAGSADDSSHDDPGSVPSDRELEQLLEPGAAAEGGVSSPDDYDRTDVRRMLVEKLRSWRTRRLQTAGESELDAVEEPADE